MNSFQELVDQHKASNLDTQAEAFAKHARNRAKFFLKHGERFDRRLYSDVCAVVAIYMNFVAFDRITGNSELFKEIVKIQKDMLDAGQQVYDEFP